MSDTKGTFDRIRALLEEGGIAATPTNYEFLYRYVTGADPSWSRRSTPSAATPGS